MPLIPTTATNGPRRPAAVVAVPTCAAIAILAFLAALCGCDHRPRPLSPRELDANETTYVTRVVVLERVKAAMLVDARRGATLGDSLVVTWGDSAQARTLAMAPDDPTRAARVHDLLLRLLAAEHDSLLRHGGLRPLDAPLPVPADSVPGSGFPASSRVRAEND